MPLGESRPCRRTGREDWYIQYLPSPTAPGPPPSMERRPLPTYQRQDPGKTRSLHQAKSNESPVLSHAIHATASVLRGEGPKRPSGMGSQQVGVTRFALDAIPHGGIRRAQNLNGAVVQPLGLRAEEEKGRQR